MTSPLLRVLALAPAILLAACNHDSTSSAASPAQSGQTPPVTVTPVATAPDYWPTTAWQTATPESHGFGNGALNTLAADTATALPYYTSLLVIKDGYIVHESYHDTAIETGSTVDTKHNVWSVSKSVTSMTVGRALTKGDLNIPAGITDKTNVLDLTVQDVFPAATYTAMAAGDLRRTITLRDVLQMRSGLAWNEAQWLGRDMARDPVLQLIFGASTPNCVNDVATTGGGDYFLCLILNRPLEYTPGTTWNYDTYGSHLVSGFFTRLTGRPLSEYARENLMTPLGITQFASSDWPGFLDPYTFGGGLLNLRSRDLAKLGLLMQYQGKWDGEQLLSPQWLETSLAIQGPGYLADFDEHEEPARDVNNNPAPKSGNINYGMQWWRSTRSDMTGIESITAIGLYGQQMSIFRDKGLIILITCDSDTSDPRDRYVEINAFLKTHILDKLP